MTVVTNEEKGPTVGKVELHPDQTVGVTGEVMQRYALAEIHRAVIESFPVQFELFKISQDRECVACQSGHTFM